MQCLLVCADQILHHVCGGLLRGLRLCAKTAPGSVAESGAVLEGYF